MYMEGCAFIFAMRSRSSGFQTFPALARSEGRRHLRCHSVCVARPIAPELPAHSRPLCASVCSLDTAPAAPPPLFSLLSARLPMARDTDVKAMDVEGENRAPEAAHAAAQQDQTAKEAAKQTPASPTAPPTVPASAAKDAPASPSDAPTPVLADTPTSPTAFPASAEAPAAAVTPATPAAASSSAASTPATPASFAEAAAAKLASPATPITPASSAEAAAAKLARKAARRKKRLALEAAKKLSALGPAGSNATSMKSFIDDSAHLGEEDDEDKDAGDDLDNSDDEDEEDAIDPKAEAEGLAELEQNFISKEGTEDSYGDKRSAMLLNRQLDEENEAREIEKLKKRMGVREENKQMAATAAGALAAALSAAAAGNGSSGSASAPSRPRNLGDRIFHAAAAAEQIALGKARAIKCAGEGEQDGQDEDARAVAELTRRKAEQAELRRLKLARGRILKPQHLGPATGTTTNAAFAAANNMPTLSASAPLPSTTSQPQASSDPAVDASDVTMLADSVPSRPGTPTLNTSAGSAPTLSRQDSFSTSHSLLSCSMSRTLSSSAVAMCMSDSQIALLGGIKKTNVALGLGVVGLSRTKTLPPSSASSASVSGSVAVMAATIPVVRTASIFAPSASAASSSGSSKLSNFDTFNQEITRKANVGLIRTGSFLQRAQSSGGALLRRGLTEAMHGPPSAAGASGGAGVAAPSDAKDFSHMFSSNGKPVVRALGGAGGAGSASMGGMAAAKLSKKTAQGTKQAFVFKAAGAGASRDGFENERSSSSAAAASAAVPSPSVLSRSATGSGSSSGAASPASATGGAMSFSAFMSSTPAALAGMKRQSSSHSLSGYEDDNSRSAKPSALLQKLKKNKL